MATHIFDIVKLAITATIVATAVIGGILMLMDWILKGYRNRRLVTIQESRGQGALQLGSRAMTADAKTRTETVSRRYGS